MTEQSPLAGPSAWNAVAEGYTTELLPIFALYAEDALALSDLTQRSKVIDVAAGPGTLSLLAAECSAQVSAVDFSPAMVDICKRRVAAAGVSNVKVQQADGQALPFDDAAFDAAFSMFGLMFFPDRSAGFKELLRVLKPGCRAVVSSWAPVSQAPLLAAMFDALGEQLPDLTFGRSPAPLSDPEAFRQEMHDAGFRSVQVHARAHRIDIPSVRQFWQAQEKASAPIALLQSKIADEHWQDVSAKVIETIEAQFGADHLSLAWPAHLAVGVR